MSLLKASLALARCKLALTKLRIPHHIPAKCHDKNNQIFPKRKNISFTSLFVIFKSISNLKTVFTSYDINGDFRLTVLFSTFCCFVF